MDRFITSLVDHLIAQLGEEMAIVTARVPQDLPQPALLVRNLTTEISRDVRRRYWEDADFVLTYVPEDGETDQEAAFGMGQRILFIADEVPYDEVRIKARSLSSRWLDDALVINVSYRIYYGQEAPRDPNMVDNTIHHYTTEDGYKGSIKDKEDPKLWKLPKDERPAIKIYPGMHPLDPRYKKDGKMWESPDEVKKEEERKELEEEQKKLADELDYMRRLTLDGKERK